ncbi:MAG: transposase [Trichodesmium erythraeum GBRTRLIN201]|nr:transposase [Trichodesmium erythraeum GBRTRLIN201]
MIIELIVTLSCLFGLPGRQTQRFIESVFQVDGIRFTCARLYHCIP